MRKTIVQELKELGKKVCPEGTIITGETASEVIHCIATYFERGTSVPDAPEEDGDYKLVIASGVASWVKITE